MRRPIRNAGLAGAAVAALFLAGSIGSSARRLPGVVFVRVGATGPGDGSSWANAYPRLADAIAAALPGDQIWVAAGRYTPAPGPGDRTATFTLKNLVTMYGGFTGTETALGQRDWAANRTVLSGDLAGDDGPNFANRADNCYHVVTALNVDESSVIDGFVISGGHANGPGFGATPDSKDQGSGMNVYTGTPRLANCTFEDNFSGNHGALNDHGGCTLTACTFRNNYAADHGAGLYMHVNAATLATGCTFTNNVAALDGGGAYSKSVSGAMVVNSTFTGNGANKGAGMYNATGSTATIRNCTFTDNPATTGGGGMYADHASPTLVDCTFSHNSGGVGVIGGGGGGGGSGGGGFWASGGAAILTNCLFTDNSASFGGGVYNNESSHATTTNCTFVSNHANEAGGLYALSSDVSVAGCTFTGNTASDGAFSVGGGLSAYFANPVVTGCTFIANTAAVGGGGLYTEGEAATVIGCTFHRNAAVGGSNCCGSDGWGGAVMFGYFSSATLTDCVMTANRADLGGAVFTIALSTPRIVNGTIVGNTGRLGGGAYGFNQGVLTITGSIVWANSADQIAGDPATVGYCCVQGGAAWAGGGPHNTDADPRLVRLPSPGADGVWGTPDDDQGDLRLRSGSPCIDAGSNAAIPPAVTTDMAGRPRFRDDTGTPDSGAGSPPIVDLGAYEFQGHSCRPDWDGNDAVDPSDVAAFVGAWFGSLQQGNTTGDFDLNGSVQPADVAAFVQAWFGALMAGC